MSKATAGWIWLGAGLAGAYFGWVNRRLWTVHDVTTGESTAYPSLRSRVYYAEIGPALSAAQQALARLSGWQLVSHDTENDILEAAVKSPRGLTTDDVTVYFFDLGQGQTRVTVRSRTRAGLGDLGRNAAHIRQIQSAMDDRLHTGAAF